MLIIGSPTMFNGLRAASLVRSTPPTAFQRHAFGDGLEQADSGHPLKAAEHATLTLSNFRHQFRSFSGHQSNDLMGMSTL
jgi:hypothetical protein